MQAHYSIQISYIFKAKIVVFWVLRPFSSVSVTSVGSSFRTRGWVVPELMCIKWQEKNPAT
jgi:hypothetical protein